jgi:hypothetical protein
LKISGDCKIAYNELSTFHFPPSNLISKGGENMRGELKTGRKAPDFELQATTGHKIRLSDYEEKKNVILVSFPLAFTPV